MIEEKGPWAAAYTNDKAFIESADFTHDVRLYVSGDFESIEQRFEYAEEIAKRLNMFATRDAEIAELKVVSDHNLHIYQEAASKMRAEIAELKEELALCCEIREGTTMGEQRLVRWVEMQEEIATLREQVKQAHDVLNEIKTTVEFWVSCNTEFSSAYSALLSLINKALAATEPK